MFRILTLFTSNSVKKQNYFANKNTVARKSLVPYLFLLIRISLFTIERYENIGNGYRIRSAGPEAPKQQLCTSVSRK